MIYQGVAKGTAIELDKPLPYAEGQRLRVFVKPQLSGNVAVIRRAMQAPPHLQAEDVDELEQAIEAGRLPVRHEGIFDGNRLEQRR